MSAIVLRFVNTEYNWVSSVIRRGTQSRWSHVEAVTPEGEYLGALMEGGVAARPSSYDTTWTSQLAASLPATAAQTDAFYAYLRGKVGAPYNQAAIAAMFRCVVLGPGAVAPTQNAFICSALMSYALVTAGVVQNLAKQADVMTPADVLGIAATLSVLPSEVANAAPLAMRLPWGEEKETP